MGAKNLRSIYFQSYMNLIEGKKLTINLFSASGYFLMNYMKGWRKTTKLISYLATADTSATFRCLSICFKCHIFQ